MKTLLTAILLVLSTSVWPAPADSVVAIDVYKGKKKINQISGVVVAQDVVVTNSNLLARGDGVKINVPDFGIELDAEVLVTNEHVGIAVLQTIGMSDDGNVSREILFFVGHIVRI